MFALYQWLGCMYRENWLLDIQDGAPLIVARGSSDYHVNWRLNHQQLLQRPLVAGCVLCRLDLVSVSDELFSTTCQRVASSAHFTVIAPVPRANNNKLYNSQSKQHAKYNKLHNSQSKQHTKYNKLHNLNNIQNTTAARCVLSSYSLEGFNVGHFRIHYFTYVVIARSLNFYRHYSSCVCLHSTMYVYIINTNNSGGDTSNV